MSIDKDRERAIHYRLRMPQGNWGIAKTSEVAGLKHPFYRNLGAPRNCADLPIPTTPTLDLTEAQYGLRPWVHDFLTPYQHAGVRRAMAQDSLMLYWPCGVGKTAASVAITQAWRAETPMRVITVTKAGTRAQFRREIERLTYQKPMILEGRNASMIDRRVSWVVT